MIFKNAFVKINTVDLSALVKQVTLSYKAEQQDDTAMGDSSRSREAGLLDWDVSIEFHQSYASAEVDATLFPLVGAAAFAVELRPQNTTVSATNPKYTGNANLESYQPMGGTVGDHLMAPARLIGVGTLTRATS